MCGRGRARTGCPERGGRCSKRRRSWTVRDIGVVWWTSVAQRKNHDSKLMMPLNTLVILVRPTLIVISPLVKVASRTEETPYVATDKLSTYAVSSYVIASFTKQSILQLSSISYKWHQFLVSRIRSAETNQPIKAKLAPEANSI